MALDKENNEKEKPKIVGLDDSDLEDGKNAESESKPSLIKKYKKFIIPGAIAIGSFLIAIAAVMFFGNPNQKGSEHAKNDDSKKLVYSNGTNSFMNGEQTNEIEIQAALNKEQNEVNVMTIDTAKIMADLAFLDYVPEMEGKTQKGSQKSSGKSGASSVIEGMTPQDSVDTLNWLASELAKLEKAKAEHEKRLKTLRALEAKIDAAMARIREAEEAHTKDLARLYDGMRPEQVGKLFENLSDKAIMAIIPKMKPANAAKILAIMPPKRAANISTKMITLLEE